MHLRRAFSQQSGGFQVAANQVSGKRRGLAVEQLSKKLVGGVGTIAFGFANGVQPCFEFSPVVRNAPQIIPQGSQRVVPCVSLVRHESLKDCHAHGLILTALVSKGSSHGREMAERCALGEECSDLNVRVDAFLQTAKDLQDQSIGIRNRGVTLLHFHGRRLERAGCRTSEFLESTGRPRQDLTGGTPQLAAVSDGFKKRPSQAFSRERLIQEALFLLASQPGNDRSRQLLCDFSRLLVRDEGQRNNINVRGSLGINDFDEDDIVERRCLGNGYSVEDPHRLDVPRFPREPAPGLEEARQNGFQSGPGRRLKHALPCSGHVKSRNLNVRSWHAHLRPRTFLALQRKGPRTRPLARGAHSGRILRMCAGSFCGFSSA